MQEPDVDARRAGAIDRPALAHLAQVAVEELRHSRGGGVWARREGAWLTAPFDAVEPADAVLVGTLDEVVVGAAVLAIEPFGDDARLAVLRGIYVEPEARELGVGEMLIEEVLALARAGGCEGIDSFELPGDRATKNFFETHGLIARGIVVHRRIGAREP